MDRTIEDSKFQLPDLLELSDCSGDWSAYQEMVYQVFKEEFVLHIPKSDKPIQIRSIPVEHQKENTFWHLVSEDNQNNPGESNRTIDIERCKRIRWIKYLIEAKGSEHVVWWKNERRRQNGKKSTNIVISLLDFSYIVVLSDRRSYYLLLSAYPIRKDRKRDSLRQEYEQYLQSSQKVGCDTPKKD